MVCYKMEYHSPIKIISRCVQSMDDTFGAKYDKVDITLMTSMPMENDLRKIHETKRNIGTVLWLKNTAM